MPQEGQTGTLPDGTRVIYMDGAPRRMNDAGMADLGGGFFKNPQGRLYKLGPKGGFSQVGGPSQAQVEDYGAKAGGVNNALGALDMFDKKLRETRNIGPFGWITNGDDLAEASQLAEDLMLRLKETPYNLGVLNGPDREILEAVIANPTKLKDAVFRKSITPRLRNIAAKLGDAYRTDSATFNGLGGGPGARAPLYQAPDSVYSKEEWGREGTVPAAKAPARRGDAPRVNSQPARSAPAPGVIRYDVNGNRIK